MYMSNKTKIRWMTSILSLETRYISNPQGIHVFIMDFSDCPKMKCPNVDRVSPPNRVVSFDVKNPKFNTVLDTGTCTP